jgi:hypothetical protein
MGLISDVLLAPLTGPVHGLRFVLNSLREQVDAESANEENGMQEELVALNMRLELGEITDEEFQAQESVVLEKLKALRARHDANETTG